MAKNIVSFTFGAVFVALVFGVLALAGAFDDDDDGGGDREPARAVQQQQAPGQPVQSPPAARGRWPTSMRGCRRAWCSSRPRVGGGRACRGSLPFPFPDPDGGNAPRVEPPPEPTASGSGFVIDAGKGLIVTNQHVVEGTDEVRIRFGEEGEPVDAKVRGSDASTDIALLEVDPDDVEGDKLTAVSLGSSQGLRPGDATIAIGAPFGLAGTVTTGIVSALDRTITAPNGFQIDGVVQTDAAINPGNSGGPLLDAAGRVIGINSQIAAGSAQTNSGVGFAVPVDTLKAVVPDLERDGKVDRAYLGVSSQRLTEEVADRLNIDRRDGALVAQVVNDGPADDAGVHQRDVIVEIDGKPVDSPDDVVSAVTARKPGDEIEIKVVRGKDEKTLKAELGKRPSRLPQNP